MSVTRRIKFQPLLQLLFADGPIGFEPYIVETLKSWTGVRDLRIETRSDRKRQRFDCQIPPSLTFKFSGTFKQIDHLYNVLRDSNFETALFMGDKSKLTRDQTRFE